MKVVPRVYTDEAVIGAILGSFDQEALPPRPATRMEDSDEIELETFLGGRRWVEIPPRDLWPWWHDFGALRPEGLAYYLPALMIAELTPGSEATDFHGVAVDRLLLVHDDREFVRQRPDPFAGFGIAQIATVIAFLGWATCREPDMWWAIAADDQSEESDLMAGYARVPVQSVVGYWVPRLLAKLDAPHISED